MNFPLLFFPTPAVADRRDKMPGGRGSISRPAIERQRARITPQLAVLRQAFEAKRLQLQQQAPLENPELVLVLEVAGTVQNFANAVNKVPGLEWLVEWADDQIAADDDFHSLDAGKRDKPVTGRLYLLGTNQEALDQLLALWNRYQAAPTQPLNRGLAPFKHVFAQLRAIRPWDATDRIDVDMRAYWQDQVDNNESVIRFEVEAWYFGSDERNRAASRDIGELIRGLNGRVLQSALIKEIAYHGFLVELPAAAIRNILAGETPELLLSDRIMFFRPKAQSISGGADEPMPAAPRQLPDAPAGQPIVALLDGYPLANHALLAGRVLIDDPDGWAAGYEVKDRVHGTAMASLILHGELDGPTQALTTPLYVRPVMRPDPSDGFNARRSEHTPDDTLLIDLIHRAVRRICQGQAGQLPAAPTVRIINLSIGDSSRVFVRAISPWARLLDWLAHKYSLLFIVSAGNHAQPLALSTPRNTLGAMATPARTALAYTALTRDGIERRLLSPAESINALTVGALHADHANPPAVASRFDLFTNGGLSPLSRVGHGYRRAIKPEILMPGGRVLHLEQYLGDPAESVVDPINTSRAPGHLAALPPLAGPSLNDTGYSRGTSNAAACASNAGGRIHDVLESLRAGSPVAPLSRYDAVLLKAMLVHGAGWGALSDGLVAELDRRPEFQAINDALARRNAQKDFITRWLGYGAADVERVMACTAERATLIGVGELGADEALLFSAPLPPSLAGRRAWRRMTVTLAWNSPINPAHEAYRRAKLWVTPPHGQIRVKRENSVDDKAAVRGTVQHELLEGEEAVVFVDGDRFECKVNCAAVAGELIGKVPFALCVSLEVAVGSGIAVYEEIRARIGTPVIIQPGGEG